MNDTLNKLEQERDKRRSGNLDFHDGFIAACNEFLPSLAKAIDALGQCKIAANKESGICISSKAFYQIKAELGIE